MAYEVPVGTIKYITGAGGVPKGVIDPRTGRPIMFSDLHMPSSYYIPSHPPPGAVPLTLRRRNRRPGLTANGLKRMANTATALTAAAGTAASVKWRRTRRNRKTRKN